MRAIPGVRPPLRRSHGTIVARGETCGNEKSHDKRDIAGRHIRLPERPH